MRLTSHYISSFNLFIFLLIWQSFPCSWLGVWLTACTSSIQPKDGNTVFIAQLLLNILLSDQGWQDRTSGLFNFRYPSGYIIRIRPTGYSACRYPKAGYRNGNGNSARTPKAGYCFVFSSKTKSDK